MIKINEQVKDAIQITYFVLVETDLPCDRLTPSRLLMNFSKFDRDVIFSILDICSKKDLSIEKVFAILFLFGYEVEE